jgi:hypothetical protein
LDEVKILAQVILPSIVFEGGASTIQMDREFIALLELDPSPGGHRPPPPPGVQRRMIAPLLPKKLAEYRRVLPFEDRIQAFAAIAR